MKRTCVCVYLYVCTAMQVRRDRQTDRQAGRQTGELSVTNRTDRKARAYAGRQAGIGRRIGRSGREAEGQASVCCVLYVYTVHMYNTHPHLYTGNIDVDRSADVDCHCTAELAVHRERHADTQLHTPHCTPRSTPHTHLSHIASHKTRQLHLTYTHTHTHAHTHRHTPR